MYRHKLIQQKVSIELRKIDKSNTGKSKALSFMNRKSKHLITEIKKSILECDKMIDRIIQADEELQVNYDIITSIKGVSRQNATCIMIYTNNFKKFDCDSRKIACYYGVAPFGKQPGTSINIPARTSHFANKLIKSLLGQAAHIAKLFNPEIKAYYQQLISRGKKPQVALNNVKNKLIRIIVTLVKKKTPYDPNTYKYYATRMELSTTKNSKMLNYC